MFRLGLPEVIFFLVAGLIYLIPLAAAAWALFTLYRIRKTLDEIRSRMDSIEKSVAAR